MKLRLALSLLLLCGACAREQAPDPAPEQVQGPFPPRRFELRYEVHLEGLQPGKRVRLWVPIPSDDRHQTITRLRHEAPWVAAKTREPVWGNRMLFFEGEPEGTQARVVVRYEVLRKEHRPSPASLSSPEASSEKLFKRTLTPSSKVKVDATIAQEAQRLSAGKQGNLARARAFYEHVRERMAYDKSGVGWGQGDSQYACSVGKGNCTDFHAYFMALCLAAKIPARFQIGLYGPYEARPGAQVETGGYHCWAEFHVPGGGWVPVDISEGDKHPERASYFFGGHTPNRVTLSTGRDLVLSPPQQGAPLNYFVNPYAEQGGKPLSAKKRVTWSELPAGP